MRQKFTHITIFTYLFQLGVLFNVYAQELPRRATWQASISYPSGKPGATIQSIEANSPLQKAGLQAGDVILKVNGIIADSGESWTSIYYGIRAKQDTKLLVRRDSEVFEKTVQLNEVGKEKHTDLDIRYEVVTSDYDIAQRTIITIPTKKGDKYPAIFMVQGLSCSSIENYEGRQGNYPKMINGLVEESGMVMMRVEKPGVGDSEGDCASTDFITELEGYRAALRALKGKEYVDTTKIVIYGASMGSALAPVLVNEFNLAGVISDGVFFKTWFEHMLEIERRLRQMEGDDEATVARKMNEVFIPLYYEMLIKKRSYEEIINDYPAIAKEVYHPMNHMYGRPLSYYQQLQDFDLASAWQNIKVPVRILRGENDWIMSDVDNTMIIDVLDKVGHKDHKLVRYPGLDHWNTIHESPENSYFGKPGQWDPKILELVVNWAREMVGMESVTLNN
ncbi:PDZ domain-containing protein [Fulvivirga sp.]|uniref:PDZ domain-containing protein n=1 Tax=Fulvivirga sp. TaxID=1931237 RepID=UPI0032EE33A4